MLTDFINCDKIKMNAECSYLIAWHVIMKLGVPKFFKMGQELCELFSSKYNPKWIVLSLTEHCNSRQPSPK